MFTPFRLRSRRAASAALFLGLGLAPLAGAITYDWSTGSGVWGNPANWSPAGGAPPDAAGESANVPPGGALTLTLDVSPTIDALTIANSSATLNLAGQTLTLLSPAGFTNAGTVVSSGATGKIAGNVTNTGAGALGLRIANAVTLTLSGPTFTNNGDVLVNTAACCGATRLDFDANTTLSGTGTLRLNSGGDEAQLTTSNGATLTHSAGHSIRGRGNLSAALANAGLVVADAGGGTSLNVFGAVKTNTGTMRAESGSTLSISATTIAQSGAGALEADGATVGLAGGAVISGGDLRSLNGGVVRNTGVNTLADVSTSADFRIANNARTELSGATTNNTGSIAVNDAGCCGVGELRALNNHTITGNGSVNMSASGGEALLSSADGATLTIDTAQTVQGRGQITALLNNRGAIRATVANLPLTLMGQNKTNSGTLRSTGGVLDFSGMTVTQTATGQILNQDGAVRLFDTARIEHGTLGSTLPAVVTVPAGAAPTLHEVGLSGRLDIANSATLNLSGAEAPNNGTIVVNSASCCGESVLRAKSNLLLSGTGTIRMNASNAEARLETDPGVVLQLGGGQQILGRGQIHGAINSAGTVSADAASQVLALLTNDKINGGTFKAQANGTLQVNGISIIQTGAGETVADGGTVQLVNGGGIFGGVLRSMNGGAFLNSSGTNFLGNLTLQSDFAIPNNTSITLVGDTLTNNATILVNSAACCGIAQFIIEGTPELAGTGTLRLNASNAEAQLNTNEDSILVNESSHTIAGRGQINGELDNRGLVSADVSAQALILQTNNKLNRAQIRAAGNGLLDVNGIALQQLSSGSTLADGGTVRLYGDGIVSGGTLGAVSPSVVTTFGSATIRDVALTGTVQVRNGDTLRAAGAINNGGTLLVNSAACCGIAVLTAGEPTTFSGTGLIRLNSSNAEAQLNTSPGVTIVSNAGHSIRGRGQINAALDSAGSVVADSNAAALLLQTNAKTNRGTMRAESNGLLDVSGATVTQTAAASMIADGGTIRVYGGGVVAGGTLGSVPPSAVTSAGSGNGTLRDLTLVGSILIPNGINTNIEGTIQNNATITVNSAACCGAASLTASANATLGGTGITRLNSSGAEAQANTAMGMLLTNGFSHTIAGRGQINANLINQGTVVADVVNQTLVLQNEPKTNDGVFASNGSGSTLQVTVDVDGIGGWRADQGRILIASGSDVLTTGPIEATAGRFESQNGSVSASLIRLAAGASFSVNGPVSVAGPVDFAMTSEASWSWSAASSLTIGDPDACNSNLEAGGADSGAGGTHVSNFGVPALNIADGATVTLVDNRDNGNRNGPAGMAEAVYTGALTLGAGSTLNLNGLKLYAGGVQIGTGPFSGGMVIDQPALRAGDTNGDGMVNFDDIESFIEGLIGILPRPELCAADTNFDGVVNFDDIDSFIVALIGG